MPHVGVVVPARRKAEILRLANEVRTRFRPLITKGGRLQIATVYEVLPDLLKGFVFRVQEHSVMGNDHGRTYATERRIDLRQDVYDGMCRGEGRDRFTGAHELGHLFLHQSIPLARAMEHTNSMLTITNSEWQANTFASWLLIDDDSLKHCESIEEVAERFGVSYDAAKVRFRR